MRVNQIDHVEIEVPDRQGAAQWYRTVLGFEICPEYEFWSEDQRGSLMISSDSGNTKLALFAGQPQSLITTNRSPSISAIRMVTR